MYTCVNKGQRAFTYIPAAGFQRLVSRRRAHLHALPVRIHDSSERIHPVFAHVRVVAVQLHNLPTRHVQLELVLDALVVLVASLGHHFGAVEDYDCFGGLVVLLRVVVQLETVRGVAEVSFEEEETLLPLLGVGGLLPEEAALYADLGRIETEGGGVHAVGRGGDEGGVHRPVV